MACRNNDNRSRISRANLASNDGMEIDEDNENEDDDIKYNNNKNKSEKKQSKHAHKRKREIELESDEAEPNKKKQKMQKYATRIDKSIDMKQNDAINIGESVADNMNEKEHEIKDNQNKSMEIIQDNNGRSKMDVDSNNTDNTAPCADAIKQIGIEQNAVQRIDIALGEYYENMIGDNSNYFDENNIGLFAKWCEENGYDDSDMIKDELGNNADPNDCSLTDFTDDFPLNNNMELNEEQKNLEIFKVLQHCYKYGFDVRIKYGFDPLTDLSPTSIFLTKYMYSDREHDIIYDLSKMELEGSTRIYISQCDGVFGKKIVTDNSFEYALAIGVRNNYFPFLQYLVDIYQRHCLQFVLKDIKNRSLHQTKFKQFLRKNEKIFEIMNKNTIEKLNGAIDIYLRLCPMMHITRPLTIINDNMETIIQYLIIANDIIQLILNENKQNQNLQFQFDITIACNSVLSTQTICQPHFDNDFDEENDIKNDNDTINASNEYEDVFGNVHHKLQQNKLTNVSVALSATRKPSQLQTFENIDEFEMNKLTDLFCHIFGIDLEQINRLNYHKHFVFMNKPFKNNNFRILCERFSKCQLLYLQKILDGIYKQEQDLTITNILLFDIIDFQLDCRDIKQLLSDFLERNNNENYFEQQNKEAIMKTYQQFAAQMYGKNTIGENNNNNVPIYPHKHRINMFIDRRSHNYEQKERHNFCDDIIFYECPNGSNMLPLNENNEIVHESFLNLTQKCLIPKIGYVDGVNEAVYTMNMQPIERIRNSTLSCRTAPPGGNMLIFSFHILQNDIIKCYLFRDAQFTRFLPQDIKHILTHLFNHKYNHNTKFMQNENKIYKLISQLTYSDKLFNSWYNNRAKSV